MNKERFGSPEHDSEEHEGDYWLRFLGMEDWADYEVMASKDYPTINKGETVPLREFLEFCGDHVRPILKEIEATPADDPRRQAGIDALQRMVLKYAGVNEQ